jgi:hypothetical protein
VNDTRNRYKEVICVWPRRGLTEERSIHKVRSVKDEKSTICFNVCVFGGIDDKFR